MNLKKEIIDCGLYLQKEGLVARTWGNISARNSDEDFYITPSGKAYDITEEKDIALVKIEDTSYDKNGPKPSSEKGVHAIAYKNRKDINYIIHTHQLYASAICANEKDITLSDGTVVPCCAYGLPGTAKLKKGFEEKVLQYPEANIFLLAKHGTVIFGKTMKEAKDRANYLEKECKKIFDEKVKDFKVLDNLPPYLDDYAQMFPAQADEDKEALDMVKEKNARACAYADVKPMGFLDKTIQHLVYVNKYSKLKGK